MHYRQYNVNSDPRDQTSSRVGTKKLLFCIDDFTQPHYSLYYCIYLQPHPAGPMHFFLRLRRASVV